MRLHVLLIAIIFTFLDMKAQETYRFRTDAPQGLNIESSTTSGLSLHYILNEITVADYDDGDTHGQEIIMKGSFSSFAEGLPNLPFENHFIAVPRGAKVSVKVKENGSQTLGGIDLLPAAEVMLNNAAEQPKLRKDMSVFGKDANFPVENVTIAQPTQIRGLDVVMLNVTPFRYNPVRKTLEIIYDMDIEIRFEGGDGKFGDARYRNPAWDGILRDLVINDNMLPEAHYYERLNEAIQNREEGCEYLIITLDDSAFMAWADTLKQFRTKQGILTKVVTTADCGGNEPVDIRNYILNAYESWAIPPAAVLLFGGKQFSPQSNIGLNPYLLTSPVSWGDTYTYPSDNPFADMNGDSIPDLAISRMTVLDAAECQLQVEKLLDYELSPTTDPHYYDHPVINSGYQDNKWFAITAQVTNNFLRDKLGKHPSNLYMKYTLEDHDPTTPDSIWSVAPSTDAVLEYFGPNGAQYLPASIGYLDDWIDMEDKLPFQNAVNEGGFMTFYRDHSNPDWWCCSNIRHSDIKSFHNERPTFLFSIGCSTNNYWDNWSFSGCIADMFLHAEAGAIGSLGANTVTYSHYNDLITWGMFDYLWPDYMPTLGSQTEPGFSYPSYSLVAGKLFLSQQTFLPYATDNMKVDKTLNLFSYLGETYLNLYTETPQPLAMDAPIHHINDHWEYTLTAEAGATVCLSNKNGIIAVTRATGEPQSLTIPQMEVGEQFTLTATKKNRFCYEQTVTIISAQHPYVYLKAFSINDQDGNGQLDYGEYATIDLTLLNTGFVNSEGGEVNLLCESPYVEILQGIAQYQQMEPETVTTLNNAFKFKLSSQVPDQTLLTFKVQFNNGGDLHCDPIKTIANAPFISIDSDYNISQVNGEPSTHIVSEGKTHITIQIFNLGHSRTIPLGAKFDVKAPFINIDTSSFLLEPIMPNDTARVTFTATTDGSTDKPAWLQTRLQMQINDSILVKDTILQYSGVFENFEADTLNQNFEWLNKDNYGNDSPWVYENEDAIEGMRCFQSSTAYQHHSILRAYPKGNLLLSHSSKTSFRYKISEKGILKYHGRGAQYNLESTDEWQYAEMLNDSFSTYNYYGWWAETVYGSVAIIKIDDICFPPMHRTIAYAGNDIIACEENPVELVDAYAYDCDFILWTTDGDGHFDYDTIANPIYNPGSQDLANGNVSLTLTAFGNDTIVSKTQIRFVDEISLGQIMGDSIVNKYSNPVSCYAVERQDGIRYHWQLEPAEVGSIYVNGDEVDILWNQHEVYTEATLLVTAENGCAIEPVKKHISLIGYSTSEWHSTDFDLFPNPTNGKISLVINETLEGEAVVEVYNLLGECMMTKKIVQSEKGEAMNLDLSGFVSGLYIIKLNTENGSCTKKVSVW